MRLLMLPPFLPGHEDRNRFPGLVTVAFEFENDDDRFNGTLGELSTE